MDNGVQHLKWAETGVSLSGKELGTSYPQGETVVTHTKVDLFQGPPKVSIIENSSHLLPKVNFSIRAYP